MLTEGENATLAALVSRNSLSDVLRSLWAICQLTANVRVAERAEGLRPKVSGTRWRRAARIVGSAEYHARKQVG